MIKIQFSNVFGAGKTALALVIGAFVAVSAFGSPAMAQDAAQKKAQSAALKKSMAQALAYEPWIKNCQKAPKGKKEICGTHADYYDALRGGPYMRVGIQQLGKQGPTILINLVNSRLVPVRRKDPKTHKVVTALAPRSARWIIPAGVFIKIDDNKIQKFKFQFCTNANCLAQGKASKKLLEEMMKGSKMIVVGIDGGRKRPEIVSLKGFGAVFKGKPSDKPYNPTLLKELKKAIAKQKAYIKKQQEAAKKKK